ncbi:MAG: C39 family peptidase, partial [Eubacterium sp.]|nr:C39 family peptidase [Eubacterium sp.]
YVRSFRDDSAVKNIENHLKKGKPVIIEVNNHKQTNGRISRAYNQRWATTKHTMVLLGMTDTGRVIVADSAFREWSGTKQRVKFAAMKNLIHYMIPSRTTSYSYYYQSASSNGGYVLVY